MRHFDLTGALTKGRAQPAGSDNLSEASVSEPRRLADILRGMVRRLVKLEASTPQPYVDFEVNVSTAGATVSLNHGFGAPVRWYVVHWGKEEGVAAPTAAPALVMSTTSTTNTLILASYVRGKAVIRVEASQYPVNY